MNCPKCNQELIEVNGKYLCVDCGIEVPADGPSPTSTETADIPTAEGAATSEEIPTSAGKIEVPESLPADGASDKDVEEAVTAALSEPTATLPATEIDQSPNVQEAESVSEPNPDNVETLFPSASEELPNQFPSEELTQTDSTADDLEPKTEPEIDLGLYQDPMYDMTESNPEPKPVEETQIKPIAKPLINEQKIDSKKEEPKNSKFQAILIIGIALAILLAGSGVTAYFFLTGGK